MNHATPLSPAANAAGKLGLLLGLLLASVPTASHGQTRSLAITFVTAQPETVPYLQVTGAPPLRFQSAPIPLHPAPMPPAPPTPPAETAKDEPAASQPADPSAEPAPVLEPAASAVGTPAAPAGSKPDAESSATRTPPAILPDEARPTIRPEDFLPYFQVPGSPRTPAEVNVIVPAPKAPPAPGQLPPSSATYQQTPR